MTFLAYLYFGFISPLRLLTPTSLTFLPSFPPPFPLLYPSPPFSFFPPPLHPSPPLHSSSPPLPSPPHIQDSVPEFNEVFLVRLTSVSLVDPQNNTILPSIGARGEAEVTITPSDSPQGEFTFLRDS